jgi:YceI-like domain
MIMIRKALLLIILCAISGQVLSQRYFTRDGKIVFKSDAPLEVIESTNKKAMFVWDTESGAIEMAALIKSFRFEKALMEEHFNENYMESEKYPKAKFKGRVTNMSSINLGENGNYVADIEGDLTMHNVTQSINLKSDIVVENGLVNSIATFEIAVADYDIKIPKIVREKIAKTVQITVDLDLKPLDE